MKLAILDFKKILLVSLILLHSCNERTNNKLNDESYQIKACITNIDIVTPSRGQEGPDLLELVVHSSDSMLNNVLDSSQIENLIFKKDDSLDKEVITHHVRIKKLNQGNYKLTFITSYFIDYPIDTVREKGDDYKKTAQVLLTSKGGIKWEIDTCSKFY